MFIIVFLLIPAILVGVVTGVTESSVAGFVFAGIYYGFLILMAKGNSDAAVDRSRNFANQYSQNPEKFLKVVDKAIENNLNSFVKGEMSLINTIRGLRGEELSVHHVHEYVDRKTPEILVNMIVNDPKVEEFVFLDFNSYVNSAGIIKASYHYDEIYKFYSTVNEYVLTTIQERLDDIGFTQYTFVEVYENSMGIENGEYIYKTDKDNSIVLLRMDLKTNVSIFKMNTQSKDQSVSLSIANPLMEMNPITITYDEVRDFELFGNEQVVLDFSNMGSINKGSMTNEFLFGAGTSVVKGLQKAMSNITEKTIDLRTVQLVRKDKTDIIFKGIKIYYDLNRIHN